MILDPQLAAIVAAARRAQAPPPFSGSPEQARERLRQAMMSLRAKSAPPIIESSVDRIAEYGGGQIPVRVYRPITDATSLPTVMFFHGGGFVLGSVDIMDHIARKLCRDICAVIVAVGYRLAPEHPFPAAHDDALAASLWALRNVEILGGDATRVGLAGESAGANLAASTAIELRARDEQIRAQLLVVPGVDLARDTTMLEGAGKNYPMLNPADLRDISRLYMGPHASLAHQCPPSPLRAKSLVGLPPAVVAVAGHDPLLTEGLVYAERLRDAGVPVEILRFDDMFHPFFGFFGVSDGARRASDSICSVFAGHLR